MFGYNKYIITWPVEITHSPASGRCLTATEHIEPGTTILLETPIAFSLLKEATDRHCALCLSPVPFFEDESVPEFTGSMGFGPPPPGKGRSRYSCTKCIKQTFYCSQRCMDKDSERHKVECAVLKDLPGIAAMHKVDYTLLRLVLNIIGRPGETFLSSKETGGAVRVPIEFLYDLGTHEEYQGVEWKRCVMSACQDLSEHLPPSLATSASKLLQLACRINVNSHVITSPTSQLTRNIAVGMFPLVAIINHSCRPNCTYVTSGIDGTMSVRTLSHVSPGEELTLSYVDLYASKQDRRRKLQDTKFFTCECKRCQDQPSEADERISGFVCGYCQDPSYLLQSSSASHLTCPLCHSKTPTKTALESLDRIQNHISLTFAFANAGKIEDVLYAFKAFHRSGKFIPVPGPAATETPLLHPHHALVIQNLSSLTSYAHSENRFEDAVSYGLLLAMALEGCVPPNWPDLADVLYSLAVNEEIFARALEDGLVKKRKGVEVVELDRRAKEHFTKCWEMRRIAFGDDHPKTKDVLEQVERLG
ncbi:hypothetical protein HDU97_004026 [Phlyctochytrium planicorne]|nr:hypothetical protein HDU97_004026 [Phlyctochytrium planicorne]